MPRTNISDILKNGENFKLKNIDLSKKSTKRRFEKVKYFQRLVESRKYVNWYELSKIHLKHFSDNARNIYRHYSHAA